MPRGLSSTIITELEKDDIRLTLFLTNDHVNRQVNFRKALVDDDGAVIGDSILAFDGRITRFEIKESSRTSEITIEVASHWADFEKTAGRLTNTNSQQRFFPNDLGFAYAANTIRDLRWGRK